VVVLRSDEECQTSACRQHRAEHDLALAVVVNMRSRVGRVVLESSGYRDGCPIATVALEVSASSDEIADACADAFERLTATVATWIESDGVDPVTARDRAFLVYAAIEGALMFAKAHKSIEPLARLRAQLPLLLEVTDNQTTPLLTSTAVRSHTSASFA
jgi:hypothetical protein